MNLTQLLKTLSENEVSLSISAGKLRVAGNLGKVTSDTRDALVKYQLDLIHYLQKNNTANINLSEKTENGSEWKIQIADRESHLPMSYAQQRIWLDCFQNEVNVSYNLPLALTIKGQLEVGAMEAAINTVITRHEILRTTFHLVNGKPVQIILDSLKLNIPVINIQEADINRHLKVNARHVFSLSKGPLIKLELLKISDTDHILLMNMHHIISDEYSLQILQKEIIRLMANIIEGSATELPGLPIQYADFTVWQKELFESHYFDNQLDYWKRNLNAVPTLLDLPTDRLRPAQQTFNGALEYFSFDQSSTNGLRELAKNENVPLFVLLMSTFNLLMYRYSGQADFLIGTPVVGRQHPNVKNLIGLFVNPLVIRSEVKEEISFSDFLQETRSTILSAYANQDVPFDSVVKLVNPEQTTSYNPLVQVMFSLTEMDITMPSIDAVEIKPLEYPYLLSRFDLSLHLQESETISGYWQYNLDLFDVDTVQRMLSHYKNLLHSVVGDSKQLLMHLPLMNPEDIKIQLEKSKGASVDYPAQLKLHHLFEQQVKANGEAIAVIASDFTYTYNELNVMANRIAHHLISLGVGYNSLVGLYLDRSPEMVTGILGVLKAGAAYVPLDPAYPQERTDYLVEDSGLEYVLTQNKYLFNLHFQNTSIVCLDDISLFDKANSSNPDLPAATDSMAYIIYTSGSTGKPKGVRGSHQAMVNRILWLNREVPVVSDDVFCQKTSIGFVDHVAEIFQPLSTGRPLLLMPDDILRDADLCIQMLKSHKVTRISLVPSLLKNWLDRKILNEKDSCLRCVISSGEALTMQVARLFRHSLPGVRLFNFYGSTEVAADVAVYELKSVDLDMNTFQYFIDDYLNADQKKSLELEIKNTDHQFLREKFSDLSFPVPESLSSYLEDLQTNIISGAIDLGSDTYIGHMTSKLPRFTEEISKVVARLNQNVVKLETSGTLTFVERQVIAMMHKLFFGFKDDHYVTKIHGADHLFGVVTSGGTISNITALHYARNRKILQHGISKKILEKKGFYRVLSDLGYTKVLVLGTCLCHYSMRKAISLFGIGEESLLYIPHDENMKMSVPHLEETLQECEDNHYFVISVIGIAGATETGTVDPLKEIAEVTKKYNVHFHVDAAWGGAFQFSEANRYRLSGIEDADSITLCPHKQLYLPQGISLCLFKNSSDAEAIAVNANYQASKGSLDMGQYTIEGSRPANILFLHASLHLIGKKGYGWLIDQSMEKATYFAKLIENSSCFQLVGGYPDLNIVNYRYIPIAYRNLSEPFTDDVLHSINDAIEKIQIQQFNAGRTFVSKTSLILPDDTDRYSTVFRAVISNPLTTFDSLRDVLLDQIAIASEVVEGGSVFENENTLNLRHEKDISLINQSIVPIGKPIDNSEIYIVNDHLQLQPIGVTGELLVGGDALAIEYWNRPELTAEKFIHNPFSKIEGARLYRTGDLGRRLADGTLEYRGRIGHQVKLRGFRIELGEIEACLVNLDQVDNAVVDVRKNSADELLLVAYVVPSTILTAENEQQKKSDLLLNLQKVLPHYMVPQVILFIQNIPLGANGKVDRKALPVPDIVVSRQEG